MCGGSAGPRVDYQKADRVTDVEPVWCGDIAADSAVSAAPAYRESAAYKVGP